MEIHLMSSCLLLNSRLTPEASTTPQLVHSIGRRCLGTPLSLILVFFVFLGGWNLNCKKEIFLSQKVNNFQVIRGKQTKGEEDPKCIIFDINPLSFERGFIPMMRLILSENLDFFTASH